MPNWCEGNIRVRGTYEQIVRFFSDNLKALIPPSKSELGVYEDVDPHIEKGKYVTVISKPGGLCCEEFYIKETNRQFIDQDSIELLNPADDPDEIIVICVEGFKSAWHLKPEDFVPMAKKYGVDIKIFGFERGMEFSETAEILKDGSVIDKVDRYNDWDWECPRPNLGG